MSQEEGRGGSSYPPSPQRSGLLGPGLCKPGTTNPRCLQTELFRDPRGQRHQLKFHARVRRAGTLANPGEGIKQFWSTYKFSHSLQETQEKQREEEKERGQKKRNG